MYNVTIEDNLYTIGYVIQNQITEETNFGSIVVWGKTPKKAAKNARAFLLESHPLEQDWKEPNLTIELIPDEVILSATRVILERRHHDKEE